MRPSHARRARLQAACPICGVGELNARWYSYLPGMYLGDGCISEGARKVFKLRIVLDNRYPGIIDECARAMIAVRPAHTKVGRVKKIGCTEVCSYWKHWPCLFPQHGPGAKHLRPIELVPWQRWIATYHPDRLLRGLIHSDGCRSLNYVNGKGYLRYQFSNNSEDIRQIFCEACDAYGVAWRQSNWKTISVSRAGATARREMIAGPKM